MDDNVKQMQEALNRPLVRIIIFIVALLLISGVVVALEMLGLEKVVENIPQPELVLNSSNSLSYSPPSNIYIASTHRNVITWRNLRLAAVIVSVVTAIVVGVLVTIHLYRRFGSHSIEIRTLKYPVKTREAAFFKHQTESKSFLELRQFYKAFIENDENFNLHDVSGASAYLRQTVNFSTSVYSQDSIECLSTDSYLEIMKRIANKNGQVMVLLPFTIEHGSLFFLTSQVGSSGLMAVPVDSLSDEDSRVALKWLTGPY